MNAPSLDDLRRSKDNSGKAVFQYLQATAPQKFNDQEYGALWDAYEMHLGAWDWRLCKEYGANWLEGCRG
jgi:hypothetical protein